MKAELKEASVLRALEEQLLRPEIRENSEMLGNLLADEFIEFGSSGRTYNKASILERLPREERHSASQSVQRTITEFAARRLASRIVLVTYSLGTWRDDPAEAICSRRSSIWRLAGGRWQILFHQGTPVPPPLLGPS